MTMMSTTAVSSPSSSSFTVTSSSSRHRARDCLRGGGGGAKMNSLNPATTTTRKKKRGVAVEVKAMGWFSNNKDIDGRDETFRRQQEILAKRRKGGRIDEEANKRRAKVSGFMKKTLSKKEMDEIKKQNTQAANKLSKEAVKGGIPFPMASFGMPEFDGGERFDLRGPYADEGWVDEKDLEKQKKKLKNKGKGGGGLFGGLFGK